MDSRCSFHITPNKNWFEEIKLEEGGHVLLCNNKSCKIMGIGSIRIKIYDGVEQVLQNVRFILELNRNLISLDTLDTNGYTYKAESGVLRVTRGCLVIMKGIQPNGLYVL